MPLRLLRRSAPPEQGQVSEAKSSVSENIRLALEGQFWINSQWFHDLGFDDDIVVYALLSSSGIPDPL